MTRVDLLLANISQLLTMRAPEGWTGGARRRVPGDPQGPAWAQRHLGVIEGAAVAVHEGRVVGLGPQEEVVAAFESRQRIDARGRVVTPGLVDSHTHLVFAGTRDFELAWKLAGRSYGEITASGGGIPYTRQRTRDASEEELLASAVDRATVALKHGTTTLEVKSGYGLDVAGEVKQLRVASRLGEEVPQTIVPTFLGAHLVAAEWKDDRETYVGEVIGKQLPAVAAEGLAAFIDVFADEGAFTAEEAERILAAGRQAGLGLRVHADEFVDTGIASLAVRMGAASADHLLAVGDDGIEALASCGGRTVATLLPLVPFALMQRDHAPARRLLDAGAAVALATDFNPNVPCLNLQMVLWHAVYGMRMGLAEALLAVTANGAWSLGLVDEKGMERRGVLREGARADLVVWDVPRYEGLFYEFGRNHAWRVACAGEVFP